MKDQLIFDVTSADTIADSDHVGALLEGLRSGAKQQINSQQIDSQEWINAAAALFDGAGNAIGSTGGALDVNVASGDLSVDLDHTEDSVALGDGTSLLTSTTVGADIGLDVNVINSVISVDDNGSSLTVDASDLDIRDLSAAQDSVQANMYDGAGTALTSTLVGADQALDVNVVQQAGGDDALADTDLSATAVSVDTTAGGTDLAGTDLSDRKYAFIYNNGNRRIYIGKSGVSTSTGFPVSPRSYLEMRAGDSIDLHAISAGGSQDVRFLELS